ncbi:hypothetical protein HED63_16370 [Ochrobactrum cytisi]|nr:hypothetical protein [Brucella cytisi]
MAPEMTRAAGRDAKNGVVPRSSGSTPQIAETSLGISVSEDVVHPLGYSVEKARK